VTNSRRWTSAPERQRDDNDHVHAADVDDDDRADSVRAAGREEPQRRRAVVRAVIRERADTTRATRRACGCART